MEDMGQHSTQLHMYNYCKICKFKVKLVIQAT